MTGQEPKSRSTLGISADGKHNICLFDPPVSFDMINQVADYDYPYLEVSISAMDKVRAIIYDRRTFAEQATLDKHSFLSFGQLITAKVGYELTHDKVVDLSRLSQPPSIK